MIIVKLIGGLGNQMFQYAAGKSLALKLGVPLKLDLSDLQKKAEGAYTQRYFELDRFDIQAEIATADEIRAYVKNKNSKILRVLQRQLPFVFKHVYFAEIGSKFMPGFNNLGPHTYLDGFWQSELYFENYRKEIQKAFTVVEKMPEDVKELQSHINSVNSVAMHVRRGDYVNLPSAAAFHGTCSKAYYEKALRKIIESKINPEVFIFSDDLAWCKENLKFDTPTHYVNQSGHAIWDIYLMRLCNHQVIANSSFSWWAAWLNQHTNKRVFVPEYWFNNIQTNAIDILAKNWEIIPNE